MFKVNLIRFVREVANDNQLQNHYTGWSQTQSFPTKHPKIINKNFRKNKIWTTRKELNSFVTPNDRQKSNQINRGKIGKTGEKKSGCKQKAKRVYNNVKKKIQKNMMNEMVIPITKYSMWRTWFYFWMVIWEHHFTWKKEMQTKVTAKRQNDKKWNWNTKILQNFLPNLPLKKLACKKCRIQTYRANYKTESKTIRID